MAEHTNENDKSSQRNGFIIIKEVRVIMLGFYQTFGIIKCIITEIYE